MPAPLADHPPSPRLAFRVGVTGHRLTRLLQTDADLPGVEAAVRDVLIAVQKAVRRVGQTNGDLYRVEDPILRVVTPLAEGGDQIVGRIGHELGMRLDVPIPFPQKDYLSRFQLPKDAQVPDPAKAFEELIKHAASVQVLDGTVATSESRSEAYFQVGTTVLRHSDLLIAIWDGDVANGRGGTAEIVDQARSLKVPIVWITPMSPESWSILGYDELVGTTPDRTAQISAIISTILAGPPAAHLELDGDTDPPSLLREYLTMRVRPAFGGIFDMLVKLLAFERPKLPRQLPSWRDYEGRTRASWSKIWAKPTPLLPAMSTRIEAGLLPYYAWASGLADRFGALHRDVFSSMYLLAPLAVLAALFAQFGGAINPAVRPVLWARVAVIEFLILAFIVGMYRLSNKGRYHSRWIEYRSLAEQLRQLIFLWPLGRPTRTLQFRGESASEASRFTWISWYCRAVIRELGLFHAEMTPEYLSACKSLLVDRMIDGQITYHKTTAHRMHRVFHFLHTFANFLFVAALAVSAIHLWHLWAEGHLSWSYLWSGVASAPHEDVRVLETHWLGVLAVLLPTIAAAAHGFLSQGDFWNLQRRFERMYHELTQLSGRLKQVAPTSVALGDAAEEAAEALDDEVLNWRVFVRLKPISLI